MLRVEGVTVAFGDVTAVDDVTFGLTEGQVLAVLGPSGCGKSTLLRALAGLEAPRSGRVLLDDRDVTGVPTHRRGFALMFQDGQLFGHLSVGANVAYPLRLRRVPRAERRARVGELLELVGLPGCADRHPATLSGGEQQRVALARALAVRPRLLLLDEPLSALDRSLRERLAADLHEILRAAGTTALLVTHDHDEAFAVADRMAVMRAGRLVQQGTLEQVWRAPADPWTARFLGYAEIVAGAPLGRLAAATGPAGEFPLVAGWGLALRRSALRLDPNGPLPATVLVVRSTAEQTRLAVDVEGVGRLPAVAPLGVPLAVGEPVRLSLDPTRVARVPLEPLAHGPSGSSRMPAGKRGTGRR